MKLLGEESIEAKGIPFLKDIFENAVVNIAKQTNTQNWKENREQVKIEILMHVGNDLYGFILDDLAIDRVKLH